MLDHEDKVGLIWVGMLWLGVMSLLVQVLRKEPQPAFMVLRG
jgi:hypothetical protein